MCIRYQIAYHCAHTAPLDPHPTLCATAIARLVNVRNPHPGDPLCDPVVVQAIPSDDVCPGCATVFAGLLKRAGDRQRRRRRGELVDEGEERIVLGARGWPLLDRWVERTRFRLMIARFGEALAGGA